MSSDRADCRASSRPLQLTDEEALELCVARAAQRAVYRLFVESAIAFCPVARDMEGRENVVFRADELPNVGTRDIQYRLVAASRRDRKMSILSETYEPNTDTGEDLLSHSGEEGGVIVEGELELTVAGKTWLLGLGDAYYFDSRLPHRFRNTGQVPARIVSANSPPTI